MADSTLKNNQLELKLDIMETVALDISGREVVELSSSKVVASCEKPEEDINQTDTKNMENTTTTSENLLSKYFNAEDSGKNTDSIGLNFFNAISQESSICESVNGKTLPLPDDVYSVEATIDEENIVETYSKDGVKPSTLLRFFSDEKSGTDSNGKAFFDKIAKENYTGNLSVTEPPIIMNNKDSIPPSPVSGDIEDAWLPSEKTRQILMSIFTSKSTVNCDKSLLTNPSIVVDSDMTDPVKTLLIESKSPSAQQRQVLSASDVSPDEAGLMKLMEANCYHAAINLTRQILLSCGQTSCHDESVLIHTPFSLRVWYIRLALFVKLRKFNLAEAESVPFGDFDKADLYYEYYPDIYNGKRGSIVPFAFRLLLAELPQHQGNYQATLDNLYYILGIVQKIVQNLENGCAEDGSMIELSESRKSTSLSIWNAREKRVLHSILNCVLAQKDYVLAVSIVQILINKSEDKSSQLYSVLGRVYLQLGDVSYAQEYFSKASRIDHEKSESHLVDENINKALLAVSQNNNEEAYDFYEKAYSLDPNNAMIVNNMAVCLLYMGKLKNSLTLLEEAIHKNPEFCLHDGILFNISTLYELESSQCIEKKVAMLELLAKHVGDYFNIACLKIQPPKV